MTQNQVLDEISEELDGYKTFGSVIDIEFVKRVLDTYKIGDLGDVSDGYHTFNELYDFRMVYNALLFNEWAKQGLYEVHKSKRHYDGEYCFHEGLFIVCATLPDGQISNHYENKYWDLFKVRTFDRAKFPYDGHTPTDALNRMKSLINK